MLRGARQAGPCAAIRADDTFADTVAAAGVVLVGDAGGYASPITGQGLSLAFADVVDVAAVILSGDVSPHAFADYSRRKRHRLDVVRFGTEVTAAVSAERCANRSARIRMQQHLLAFDDQFRRLIEAEFSGPHAIAPNSIHWDQITQIRDA